GVSDFSGALSGWGALACLWGGLAGSRPGGRGTFLCFAKEKYPKERRAGCAVPSLRYGHTALLGLDGVARKLAFGSDKRAP
ncbi:MAG TPA: hypothetical protein PKE60_08035, partial [Hydrogenophaga sp.]|nr:hypothetical protein [Hydrogenophaga sp.]